MISGLENVMPPSVDLEKPMDFLGPKFQTVYTCPKGPVTDNGKLCPNVVSSEIPDILLLTGTGTDQVFP